MFGLFVFFLFYGVVGYLRNGIVFVCSVFLFYIYIFGKIKGCGIFENCCFVNVWCYLVVIGFMLNYKMYICDYLRMKIIRKWEFIIGIVVW